MLRYTIFFVHQEPQDSYYFEINSTPRKFLIKSTNIRFQHMVWFTPEVVSLPMRNDYYGTYSVIQYTYT